MPDRSRRMGFLRGRRGVLSNATEEALAYLGLAHRQRRRTAPPGAVPDTLVIPRDAPPPRIEWLRYDDQIVSATEIDDPELLRGALATDEVDWINVQGFGDEAHMRRIGNIFGIHPLAMADVVNVPQRPKVDVYGDRLLVVLRMARIEGGDVDLQQVSLVVGPGWVITFEEHPGDVFDPVRTRIRTEGSQLRRGGADFLAYALVDAVVDGYLPVMDGLADTLEELEEQAIGSPEPETLARIHSTRRLLLLLERVLRQQRDALIALAHGEDGVFGAAVQPYLRDVQDHAIHVLDSIETFREMTVGLMDIYLSSVSNRTNDVMKTLTIIASTFIPLSFVAGVYGMNFEYMPELHWRYGYAGAWLLMGSLALSMMFWFRRRGWLGALASREPDAEEESEPDQPAAEAGASPRS
jgi:magnesium transporter